VIGLPFFALFLLSVRGSRSSRTDREALLASDAEAPQVRGEAELLAAVEDALTDRRSWFAMIYMVARFPSAALLHSVRHDARLGLAGMAMRFCNGDSLPARQGHGAFYAPDGGAALRVVGSLVLVTLHLAKDSGTPRNGSPRCAREGIGKIAAVYEGRRRGVPRDGRSAPSRPRSGRAEE